MGCGSSRIIPPDEYGDTRKGTSSPAPKTRATIRNKNVPVIGIGRPVGGGNRALDKREAQLAAAEKRALAAASRGLVNPIRGAELNDSAKKQELIGKIHAVYNSVNRDIPIGLNIASVQQLQQHYDSLKTSSILS